MARTDERATRESGLQDEYTDAAIVRFCQSKRWNAKKIAKQIQQTAAWRKQVGADLYRTAFIDGKKVLSYPLVVAGLKSCPMLFALGHSKDGCPIDWTAVGHMDMNQALNLMTDDEYFEYNFICLEFFTTHFDRLSFERADGKLCKGMSVMDCAGMGWSFFWPSILKRNNMCAPLMDLYYPESYALFVCINAPGIFEVLFRVLKPFFGQDTIDCEACTHDTRTGARERRMVPARPVSRLRHCLSHAHVAFAIAYFLAPFGAATRTLTSRMPQRCASLRRPTHGANWRRSSTQRSCPRAMVARSSSSPPSGLPSSGWTRCRMMIRRS